MICGASGRVGVFGLFGVFGVFGLFGLFGLFGSFRLFGLFGLFGLVGLLGLFGLFGLFCSKSLFRVFRLGFRRFVLGSLFRATQRKIQEMLTSPCQKSIISRQNQGNVTALIFEHLSMDHQTEGR